MIRHIVPAALLAMTGVAEAQWLEARVLVDTSAWAVVYDSLDNKVYCACRGTDSVHVIDGATNEHLGSIAVGRGPVALCYNSTWGKVYSANWLSDDVSVIDCATDSVIGTVPVGAEPGALLYVREADKVYCANRWEGTIAVLDGETDSIVRVLASPGSPSVLCYNATHGKVYCANSGQGTISVFDVVTDSLLASVATLYPVDLCFNPANGNIYVAGENGLVTAIDGAADRVIATIPVDGQPFSVGSNPDENKVYCGCFAFRLHVIDCATHRVTRVVESPLFVKRLLYNPLNRKLYVGGGPLYVLDGATDSIVAIIQVGADDLAWNPIQNRIYAPYYYYGVVSVIRDSIPAPVAEGGTGPPGTVLSPTIVHGMLSLPDRQQAQLLDISGRNVMDLQVGENDVRDVSPGVYFVRSADSGTRSAVRKVIIQR